MNDKTPSEIILVRRQLDEEEAHHGGVWKIAHADFMTAMMAFFLVMWLINVTDQTTRSEVAKYFNPLKLADSVTDRKGLRDPTVGHPSGEPDNQGQPLNVQPGQGPGASTDDGRQPREQGPGAGEGVASRSAQAPQARYKDSALFQDPYAILAQLASETAATNDPKPVPTSVDLVMGETADIGITGGEAHRDPFDPTYWRTVPLRPAREETPGEPRTVNEAPKGVKPDALARDAAGVPAATSESAAGEKAAAVAETGDELAALRQELQAAFSGEGAAVPHLQIEKSGEGTLISLTDEANFSMFAIGSAEPQPQVVRIMQRIAETLSKRPGKVVVRGHTDGRPFRSADYDNWRLSTARAHMAVYMLVRGGLSDSRVERVEGHADRLLKVPDDPNAAENRRIEILLKEESP
ncbi:OmpA family protein [Chelatococcus daeguensis]|uniref:OmpA-like domain-containing protein n=2 Tax=Chelatococcus TaxID=28209 RepID=A0AAC9JSK8_9HYPH|nr:MULTISPECIES: flagellar motor protein MotB [Chelatococcus]APF38476.1 hypothetical protein BOQ54_15080 [Chelatococcus daeguensis]KZE34233.1 hypothetical protein AVW15_17070 [Chelatococcus daeguensis]MBM3083179.1 OmpA family protein [Chelatococcus daeguensis]CUA85173.1 OmpA family/Membrane MotB of proton-channel complex MotA/MotB [Chelatococcus sambhunathii]